MTPMIDVVFLLIIFFLVSSHLAQRETRLPVELPEAVSGQRDVPDDRPRMTVTLQPDGKLWLGGQSLAVEQLAARLRAGREQSGEQTELRIRCDRHVPYRQVEPVLAAAVEAGLWNVSFSVLEAQESR
jgi:biopolymer transport protein ExbD